MNKTNIKKKTGELFGDLFSAYDRENYQRSVDIFRRRFEDNGFDTTYFVDKTCLDLGCGGGRYSLALAQLGARQVTGVDISETGIADAKIRAQQLEVGNVTFLQNTAERLPFEDNAFDCVVFSGVLMHMENPQQGLMEVARVLKKGGMVYMLVYATEGVRWPLISILRNLSSQIGIENFEKVFVQTDDLDVNKRRTYLDDLFVPLIDFYTEDRLTRLLTSAGFSAIDRWEKGRLDHEETLESYLVDLKKLEHLFDSGSAMKDQFSDVVQSLFESGAEICRSCVHFVARINEQVEKGELSAEEGRQMVIGQGHHRLTAIKQ